MLDPSLSTSTAPSRVATTAVAMVTRPKALSMMCCSAGNSRLPAYIRERQQPDLV